MDWLNFLIWINVVYRIIYRSRSLAQTSSNQIDFSFVEATVATSVDAFSAGLLFAVHEDLMALEVQAPFFQFPNGWFKAIVDKEFIDGE